MLVSRNMHNLGCLSRSCVLRKSCFWRAMMKFISHLTLLIGWFLSTRNLFLQCDKCRMMVHARCYGELEPVDGVLWLCNLCHPESPDFPPPFCLCPVIGGAVKPTIDGRGARLACAIWIHETCLSDIKRMELIDGMNRINKSKLIQPGMPFSPGSQPEAVSFVDNSSKGVPTSSSVLPSLGFAHSTKSTPNTRFGSALNIETLVASAERRETPIEAPASEVQDKISFIINNISTANIEVKAKEFVEILKEQYNRWFAEYMVMQR